MNRKLAEIFHDDAEMVNSRKSEGQFPPASPEAIRDRLIAIVRLIKDRGGFLANIDLAQEGIVIPENLSSDVCDMLRKEGFGVLAKYKVTQDIRSLKKPDTNSSPMTWARYHEEVRKRTTYIIQALNITW